MNWKIPMSPTINFLPHLRVVRGIICFAMRTSVLYLGDLKYYFVFQRELHFFIQYVMEHIFETIRWEQSLSEWILI